MNAIVLMTLMVFFPFQLALADGYRPDGFLVKPAAGIPAGPETFECGNYIISGVLLTANDVADQLEIYSGTTRRYQMVLRRVHADDALSLVGEPVSVHVYVFKSGPPGEARARVLERMKLLSPIDAMEKPIRLLEKRACFESQ